MGDVGATGGSSPLNQVPGRTTPLEPRKAADAQAKMGTDGLSLSATSKADYQYFDHAPKVTVSLLMKQPIWADDRTDITSAQWSQMPESQQKEILALIPREAAKAQFLSNMDPAVAKAKAELGGLAKSMWDRAQAWSAEQDAKRAKEPAPAGTPATPAPAEAGAQVDRLNALIESSEPQAKP